MDKTLFNKDKTKLYQCSVGTSGAYTVPDTVTHIGYPSGTAFSACEELTSVTIPASVERMGTNGIRWIGMFAGCKKLTSIIVHEDNAAFSSEDGVLFDKAKTILYAYPAGKTGDYIIPDDCGEIYEGAFSDCIGLTNLPTLTGVNTIGKFAFSGTGLTSASIPDNVITFDMNVFSGCESLTNIEISEDNDTFSFD